MVQRFYANCLVRMGRVDEARPLLKDNDDVPSRILLHFYAGEWDSCERIALQQLEIHRANGVTQSVILDLADIGRARYERGDLENAVPIWQEILAICRERKAVANEVYVRCGLAITLVRLRCVDEAAQHVGVAQQLTDNGEDWAGSRALVDRATACVASARGERDTSETLFAASIATSREYGDLLAEAETHQVWGQRLLESGDRRAAAEKLDAALAIYREANLGTPWLENVLADKLRAQGSSASRAVTHTIDVVAASIDSRRPDFTPHTAPDGTVTLMFSDMEGFTEMTQRLGDLAARDVIRRHNAIVRGACLSHDGYEVELQGDGFLLAFGSARQALHCAIAIQRAFEADATQHPEQPIRVRIGVHTGEALRNADKFFGKTVILAARIASAADGGEILASNILKELTDSVGDVHFTESREVELKGFSGSHRLFPVNWR